MRASLLCVTVYMNSAIHASRAVFILVLVVAEPARARSQVVYLEGIPGSRSERDGEREPGQMQSQYNDMPASGLSLATRP